MDGPVPSASTAKNGGDRKAVAKNGGDRKNVANNGGDRKAVAKNEGRCQDTWLWQQQE